MKHILKKVSILIILSLFFVACADKKVENQTTIQMNDKLEDLSYLFDTLEAKHKNIYSNISKEDFLKEKDRIAGLTPTMSDAEFYYSLKYLLSLIGDAHTSMRYTESHYSFLNFIPFKVLKFDDDWRFVTLEKENEKLLGAKLVAINGVFIEDIFEKSKSIMSYDNLAWVEGQFSNTINTRESLEFLGVVKKDEPIIFTIKTDDGLEHKIDFKSMSQNEVLSAEIVKLEPYNSPKTSPSGNYRVLPLDKNNLFVQYNLCQEASDLSMKKFVNIVNKDLNNNNYETVIIDLRYNPGGNSQIFEPMIDMLKKYKKAKNIKVYTLISGKTFSSGIINAVQIKKELDSTLIGKPTGGSVNHFGEIKSFKLKNYPIEVYYSTKYFEMIKGYEKDSLYPDIEMSQSFEDYKSGVDTEIEWIINKGLEN